MRSLFKTFIVFFALSTPLFSQANLRVFSPGAKAIGLGRTGVVGTDGPTALYWNPSILGTLRSNQAVLVSHEAFLANYTGYNHFIPQIGSVGIHLARTDNSEKAVDIFSFGFGKHIGRHVYSGISINGMQIQKEGWTSIGFGLLYMPLSFHHPPEAAHRYNRPTDRLTIGAAIQNIPLIVTDYDHQYRIGLSYKITAHGPKVIYAHHFQRDDDTAHMGFAFRPIENIELYAGMEDFSTELAAAGIQIEWYNITANLCYDMNTKRVVFSSRFRIGEAPHIIAQKAATRASGYLDDGDRRAALKWSSRALAYDPENTDARALHDKLAPLLTMETQMLDSLLVLANSLVKRGRYMSAAANYLRALKLDPENQQALDAINIIRPKVNTHSERWYKLGVQSFENEDYTQAKDIFESIILVRPEHQESQNYIDQINDILLEKAREHYFTGMGFYNQGNVQDAETQFREALKAVPDYPDALAFLNRITEEKQSRLRKASELLVEAIDDENEGDLLNAQRRYQQILRLYPAHRSASERLQDLEKRIDAYVKKEMSQAVSYYKKARYTRSKQVLAHILALRPNHNQARTYYNRINQKTQNRFTGYLDQAKIYFANNNWEMTKIWVDSALMVNPRSAEAKKLLEQTEQNSTLDRLMENGKSAYLSGSYNEALALFNQLLHIDPDNQQAHEFKNNCMTRLAEQVDVIFNNGIRLYTEEKYRLAIAEFEKALEINPDHKGSLEYIKRAKDRLEALNRLSK